MLAVSREPSAVVGSIARAPPEREEDDDDDACACACDVGSSLSSIELLPRGERRMNAEALGFGLVVVVVAIVVIVSFRQSLPNVAIVVLSSDSIV